MKKIVVISQARLGSTRLPAKVLKTVCGKTLLEHQYERLQRSRFAHQIVIATTTLSQDDPIVDLCNQRQIPVWRGPSDDVLTRYHGAATRYQADIVVRVTSDCPLIDPEIVDEVIGRYLELDGAADYVSNTLVRSFPRGMDTEVFSFTALDAAAQEAVRQEEREHVTPFIYWRPERFRVEQVRSAEDLSCHRWTVDTPEDFELIRRILEALYPQKPCFTLRDVLDLLADHPDWSELNAHIEQKTIHK